MGRGPSPHGMPGRCFGAIIIQTATVPVFRWGVGGIPCPMTTPHALESRTPNNNCQCSEASKREKFLRERQTAHLDP